MKTFLLHELVGKRSVNGKYLVTISLHNFGKKDFWLSEKQTSNLLKNLNGDIYSTKTNEVWCVIDGERFIWSSTNETGRKWLEETFNVDGNKNTTT